MILSKEVLSEILFNAGATIDGIADDRLYLCDQLAEVILVVINSKINEDTDESA